MKVVLAILSVLIVIGYGCGEKGNVGDEAFEVGKKQVDSLKLVAFELQYNNPKACDSIADIISALSQHLNYKGGEAEAWFLKSSSQQQYGNYDSAITLAEKSLAIFIEIGHKPGIARCYNDLGINYDFKAYYDKAISYYLQALKLFEELKDSRGQANAYNNIGLIHQNQSNFREAAINYRKAFDISVLNQHDDSRLNALNNMGSNYVELKNYDSALQCFKVLLEEDLKSGNKAFISYSYNNVGEAYLGLKEYDKALVNLKKSKELKEELGNRRALANTLKNLGNLYLEIKEYSTAEQYLQEALAVSKELDLPEIKKSSLELLHQLFVSTGNYKDALDYYKQAEEVKYSISYDKKNAEISELEKEFALEKAANELEKSVQKGKVSRMMVIIYGTVSLLLLAVLGIVWYSLRQKQKTNSLLITYQQQLEEKNRLLEEKNTEINRQKKEVETALAARSRFLSFMSHEIRTPLNGITGLVDLLQTMPMAEGQDEFISALKQSSDNLMLLLNNVLDLSRLETGKVDLEEIGIDVSKLLRDQSLLYKGSALLRETEIEVFVDEDVPEKLQGDPYRLAQIISNLINNAIKFTKGGKVSIRCMLVERDNDKAKLLFEVIDTGIGIPDDQLKNILQPFAQAESYTTRKYGGTGLGLTIITRLLALMNSQLQISSKLGEGSRFYFELTMPIYRAPLIAENGLPKTPQDAGLEGLKILVVEDNTTNILLFSRILAGWKTEYDVADNGYKALDFIEQKKYDIILMDLHLPKISGYETAEKIKHSNTPNRNTPILAITAADTSEVNNHPLRNYLNHVMYKPVLYRELMANIKKLTLREI